MALLPASAGWSLLLIGVFAIDGSAPSSKPPLESTVQVSGRVLDPDGKPVAGARLYYPRPPKKMNSYSTDFYEIETPVRATTEPDGCFHFELPRSDLSFEAERPLVAAAEGYGVEGTPLRKDLPRSEITLRLAKDQPIEGTIVNTEGRALPGIEVLVTGVFVPREGRLDGFLERWKREWAFQRGAGRAFNLPGKKWAPSFITDRNGRFRITGAGRERVVSVLVKGPAIVEGSLCVVTREGLDPAPYNHAAQNDPVLSADPNETPPVLYGPKFVHVAGPGRTITGTVRESGGGKPLAGIVITSYIGYAHVIRALSDAQGKYQLTGLPKRKHYDLMTVPDPDGTLLIRNVGVAATPGLAPIKCDIELTRGISVTGRLIDKATGKGVPGSVDFNAGNWLDQPSSSDWTDARTDDAGRYRIKVLPGKGYLWGQVSPVTCGVDGKQVAVYRRVRFDPGDRRQFAANFFEEINVPRGITSLARDFYLDPGKTVRVRVQDPDGTPLPRTTVVNLADFSGNNEVTFAEPDCPVYSLDPSTPRRVLFYHAGRDLIGSLVLRGDEKETPVVRLLPAGTVTMRLLDRDGQPLANVGASPRFQDQTFDSLYGWAQEKSQLFRTDNDGRIRFRGMPPNVDLKPFEFRKGLQLLTAEPWQKPVRLAPGQTLDLGDIQARPK